MNPRRLVLVLPLLLVGCGVPPAQKVGSPPGVAAPRPEAEAPAPSAPSVAPSSEPRWVPPPELQTAAEGPSVIQVDIINRCSERIDFCVITGRSERKTRLAPSTHEWYRMGPGDSVRAMDGAYCGDVLYEVKSSPAEQKAVLCK